MNRGDKVAVYQKPFTGELYQGQATLVRCLHREAEFERWVVSFDDEPGATYERVVVPQDVAV